jgi:hypothetical protein
MSSGFSKRTRILAIDPTSRGFGFAILEGRELIEWGVAQIPPPKNAQSLARINKLLIRFKPNLIVVEDTRQHSRRHLRVRKLLYQIRALALSRHIGFRRIPHRAVASTFFKTGASPNKWQIAERIAHEFPELSARLPQPRKPWQSEPETMAVFDSVALAMALQSQSH